MTEILEVRGLKKSFSAGSLFSPKTRVTALDGVSFNVARGRTLGIIGESGSGKTTLAKIICGLEPPDEGGVFFDGEELDGMRRRLPHTVQMVFQNPAASLNPKLTVGMHLIEALRRDDKNAGALEASELVARAGLSAGTLERFPHQLSGGEKQRAAIARALAPNPKVLIADEAVSSLDVSVQAQILNLLRRLKAEINMTLIFISHDVLATAYMAEDMIVMKNGIIVESGDARTILSNPSCDYTAGLVSAARMSA